VPMALRSTDRRWIEVVDKMGMAVHRGSVTEPLDRSNTSS